ncbi:Hypothetical protein A7982_01053 [Minicystis rosea]|nr:Hypothetical protein A7982_01053 [Minicystis rosea]
MLERLVIAAGGLPASRVVPDVAAEFPSVEVVVEEQDAPVSAGRLVAIDLAHWMAPFTKPSALDAVVEHTAAQGPFGVRVVGAPARAERACLEILTRYQRHLRRRNAESATALWDRVAARHKALHDLATPLGCADHARALDAWQWVLRLDPEASLALQVAALFREDERIAPDVSTRPDSRRRGEVMVGPRCGAAMARAILAGAGVDAAVIERVADLVERRDEPSDDLERARLDEADALSFLSLASPGFIDRHGPDRTRARIARVLGRLGPAAKGRVLGIRYRPDVRALVLLALGAAASQPAL